MEHIKRNVNIIGKVIGFSKQNRLWEDLKTVVILSGPAGCGKTTLVLDYFREKKHFYFSFAELGEAVAKKLLAEQLLAQTGQTVEDWNELFILLSKEYHYIIFDDLASLCTYKEFKTSFFESMCRDFKSRPFVIFIARPMDDLEGLADSYIPVEMSYFTVPEIMKIHPTLSKFEALALGAVSGGIPQILREYDAQKGLEDNLRAFLAPDSAFMTLMPQMMDNHFRRPECYHHILCAIARDNTRISEIGKYTGYAYNKCDNYVSALVAAGIVVTNSVISDSGAAKTAYTIENSYFRLWYRHIYLNQSRFALGDTVLIEETIQGIMDSEIHAFHLGKAFNHANAKLRGIDLWRSLGITERVVYAPKTIDAKAFKYTFDAIHRHGDKAIFIKVFSDPLENCKKDELDRIERAVNVANKYYNSHIFLYTKRRFSDYAAEQAVLDKTISFVEVKRLKY